MPGEGLLFRPRFPAQEAGDGPLEQEGDQGSQEQGQQESGQGEGKLPLKIALGPWIGKSAGNEAGFLQIHGQHLVVNIKLERNQRQEVHQLIAQQEAQRGQGKGGADHQTGQGHGQGKATVHLPLAILRKIRNANLIMKAPEGVDHPEA